MEIMKVRGDVGGAWSEGLLRGKGEGRGDGEW